MASPAAFGLTASNDAAEPLVAMVTIQARIGSLSHSFKFARISHLTDLEGGTYWPSLQPFFSKPEYRRLRYRIQESAGRASGQPGEVSLRGVNGVGEIDVAYIADRLAATLEITDAGLPDFCLTTVSRGGLVCTGLRGAGPLPIDKHKGLIYRGDPGTTLSATGDHERLAIWIPEAALRQRLAALLGGPVLDDIAFEPAFDWDAPRMQGLLHLVQILIDHFSLPGSPYLAGEAVSRSYVDLLIYTLLRSVPHSHTERLERPDSVVPGTIRRAETYIRAHVEEPIALHEVAEAAGCSVRSLQLGFRRFRETTPLLAIRQARLLAAHEAMLGGTAGATLTEVAHRFGFGHPGRFTRFYKAAYGEAPGEVLRRGLS